MTIETAGVGSPGRTVALVPLLAGEIVVGTLVNLALNLFFSWLTFPAGSAVTVQGWPGLAIDLLPATVIPAIMMTMVVTAILRRRLAAGLRVAGSPRLPFSMPRPLWLRALTVGALALVLVAAPTFVALSLLWPAAGSWAQLAVFKVIFSAFHAMMLTPIVILAGLGEDGRQDRL